MKNKRGKERRGRGKKDGTGKGCGVGRCCGTQALYAVSGRPNGRITSHQALAQSANRSYLSQIAHSSVKVPGVMYQHGSHVVAHIRGQRHQDNRDRQERVRLLGKVTTPGNRFQRGEVADYAPPRRNLKQRRRSKPLTRQSQDARARTQRSSKPPYIDGHACGACSGHREGATSATRFRGPLQVCWDRHRLHDWAIGAEAEVPPPPPQP